MRHDHAMEKCRGVLLGPHHVGAVRQAGDIEIELPLFPGGYNGVDLRSHLLPIAVEQAEQEIPVLTAT